MHAVTYCLYTEYSNTGRELYRRQFVNPLAVVWAAPEGTYWGQHLVVGARTCVLCVQHITERNRGTFPRALYSPHCTVLKQMFAQ